LIDFISLDLLVV